MQPFWFAVCFTYIILGVAQLSWAASLQSVKELEVPLPLELEEVQISRAEKEAKRAKIAEELEGKTGAMGYEDISFNSVRRFAKAFNKATETNRRTLYLAAVSLFVAAGIALLQGTGVIPP
ncbi:MAG: hypothetical protein ACXVIX_09980 [Halobacteriota archaeon]